MASIHLSLPGAAVRSPSGGSRAHPVYSAGRISSSNCCFGVLPGGGQKRLAVAVRSTPNPAGGGAGSLETVVGPSAVVGVVTEVSQNTFWPIVNSAGDKTVVLDMYTQWCGPCKVIAPKYQQLAEKYLDVVFLKLDCNQENKSLAKELGIRVVPTFKILKDSKIVKEVTGAKFDDLVAAIDTVRSS